MNDKYLIQIFISGTILLMLFVFFIVAYLLVQKQKQNAYYIEKNKMIFDHQNKLLTARFEEQEQTMNLMSKEIHDNIGQLLTFAEMNMRVIGKYASDNRQTELIDRTKVLLYQVKNDVRNISHSLNSDFIKEKGLEAILGDELERIKFSQEIDCKISIKGGKPNFDPGKALLIYRIAQEAIHNITKHSGATKIVISLDYDPDVFTMGIADNGVGFEKERIYELKGIGFQNMLERTRLLDGSLDIESRPLHGCNITLRVNRSLLEMADIVPGEAVSANIL